MNLILLLKEDLIAGSDRVRLSGRRHKHIRDILKSSVGNDLCVGVEGGQIGKARLLAIDDKTVEMEVILEKDPPPPMPLTLILALPRPLVLRRVLLHATVLGIKKIILIHSERVQKSYWMSPALSDEKIREHLILGLEQAKDTVIPEILFRKGFKPFVEDELPEMTKGSRAFVAHTEGDSRAPVKSDKPAILAIGPEGGFIPYEIEKLVKSGCKAVNFGERVMNVETAVVACVSKLM
ncbi:MAG: 16S rRNA (uracil(1498)-N(3))-methyltransferase [Candidatus Tantalella remota]|nr:16S rRNA (uracil(1498)-N(3))-methyltransferase [Candidatus Tantalella remota]